jgi:hypothetical protein
MNLQEKLALACRILAMQGHNDMITVTSRH